MITEETGRRIAESLERLVKHLDGWFATPTVYRPPTNVDPSVLTTLSPTHCRYCNAPNGHGGLPCPELTAGGPSRP